MYQSITLILIGIFLLIYPYLISLFLSKNIKFIESNNNFKKIILNILIIALYSSLTLLITYRLYFIYNNAISNDKYLSCNYYGFTGSCVTTSSKAMFSLLLIGLLIIIHHVLCCFRIYSIFQNSKIFKYLFMYIHFIVLYIFTIILAILIQGIIVSYTFKSSIFNIIKFLIIIMPETLFLVSTFIKCIKKNKYLE